MTNLTLATNQPTLPGITLTPLGATITGPVDANAICHYLDCANQWITSWHWIIGDLYVALEDELVDGEMRGPRRARKLIEPLDLPEVTVFRCAKVARAVPLERRRFELSWSHHVAVADLPAQAQSAWLGRAVDARWTVAELAVAIDDELHLSDAELELELPAPVPMPPRSRVRMLLEGRPPGVWLRWQPSTGQLELDEDTA